MLVRNIRPPQLHCSRRTEWSVTLSRYLFYGGSRLHKELLSLWNVLKERCEMCLGKESKMKQEVYSHPSRWKAVALTGLTDSFVCAWWSLEMSCQGWLSTFSPWGLLDGILRLGSPCELNEAYTSSDCVAMLNSLWERSSVKTVLPLWTSEVTLAGVRIFTCLL